MADGTAKPQKRSAMWTPELDSMLFEAVSCRPFLRATGGYRSSSCHLVHRAQERTFISCRTFFRPLSSQLLANCLPPPLMTAQIHY